MSKNFKSIKFPSTYKYSSDSKHIPLEFYQEVFPIAKKIDLLLGYFSSNAFRVLSKSMAEFIYNGGEMRIITNHVFSLKDKENLLENSEIRNEDKVIDIFQDLETLELELSDYGLHFFDCLKYLQKKGRLRIQPVKFNGVDLAHCKKMILYDGSNYISTDGSINFTLSALLKNSESFEVNAPWINKIFEERTTIERENFERILENKHPNYEYIDPSQIEVVIHKLGKSKEIKDLLEDSLKLPSNEFGNKVESILKRKEERFNNMISVIKNTPKFPYESPRQYQIDAYDAWLSNDEKGIFAMATGTGKTLTSLNCLLNQYKTNGFYKAVIIVPTLALVNQWKKECRAFNFRNIITVSSKEKWPDNVSFYNSASNFIDVSYVIIVTYASFYRRKFQNHFQNLDKNTLLIADETHNLGSPNVSKILPSIHLNKRIGLSATPNRQYDRAGNSAIEIFFNDQPPFVYNYSMEKALESGWLCPYKYYPHIVNLTDEELLEYKRISKILIKFLDPQTNKFKDCKEVEMLLLKRKRIIHKAANKLNAFKDILNNEFEKRNGSLKYTLVYVPEGNEADYEKVDEFVEDSEDVKLINDYTKVISSTDTSIMVKQYTSGTKERDSIISEFQKGRIDVLTSMKCLDEGVDVPRSELAIFCSSTGNPRQFIQRRGRVLRNHPDKIFATIHDLVVVPSIFSDESNFEMEKNMVKKELERVVDFSSLSLNKIDSYEELKPVLKHFNLNLYK